MKYTSVDMLKDILSPVYGSQQKYLPNRRKKKDYVSKSMYIYVYIYVCGQVILETC